MNLTKNQIISEFEIPIFGGSSTEPLINPEGTFLVWLDFRGLGFDAKELEIFLKEHAQIALNPGYWFGRQGAGFARMTFACPKKLLEKGLLKLNKAIKELK